MGRLGGEGESGSTAVASKVEWGAVEIARRVFIIINGGCELVPLT